MEWRTKERKLEIKRAEREKGHVCTQYRGPGFESVYMEISVAGGMYMANVPWERNRARQAPV